MFSNNGNVVGRGCFLTVQCETNMKTYNILINKNVDQECIIDMQDLRRCVGSDHFYLHKPDMVTFYRLEEGVFISTSSFEIREDVARTIFYMGDHYSVQSRDLGMIITDLRSQESFERSWRLDSNEAMARSHYYIVLRIMSELYAMYLDDNYEIQIELLQHLELRKLLRRGAKYCSVRVEGHTQFKEMIVCDGNLFFISYNGVPFISEHYHAPNLNLDRETVSCHVKDGVVYLFNRYGTSVARSFDTLQYDSSFSSGFVFSDRHNELYIGKYNNLVYKMIIDADRAELLTIGNGTQLRPVMMARSYCLTKAVLYCDFFIEKSVTAFISSGITKERKRYRCNNVAFPLVNGHFVRRIDKKMENVCVATGEVVQQCDLIFSEVEKALGNGPIMMMLCRSRVITAYGEKASGLPYIDHIELFGRTGLILYESNVIVWRFDSAGHVISTIRCLIENEGLAKINVYYEMMFVVMLSDESHVVICDFDTEEAVTYSIEHEEEEDMSIFFFDENTFVLGKHLYTVTDDGPELLMRDFPVDFEKGVFRGSKYEMIKVNEVRDCILFIDRISYDPGTKSISIGSEHLDLRVFLHDIDVNYYTGFENISYATEFE
ncbi:hypothetical protein PCE1_003048 [Barthelona sp. PCE]